MIGRYRCLASLKSIARLEAVWRAHNMGMKSSENCFLLSPFLDILSVMGSIHVAYALLVVRIAQKPAQAEYFGLLTIGDVIWSFGKRAQPN